MTILESHRRNRYQLAGMVCSLIFMDNVVRKLGGIRESAWCWLASGRTEVIFRSGVLTLACQFLFWSGVVRRKK
jgi:hypothetical protein